MIYILHIDTSLDKASICLTRDEELIGTEYNYEKNDHASWLHVTAEAMMKAKNLRWDQLSAVSVCNGPGSYTGLRIGLAAAKGFCYALQVPLLTVGSLPMLALAAGNGTTDLVVPLIDARRMEVFTATYDQHLKELSAPQTLILDKESFADILAGQKIMFCGNGAKKFKALTDSAHAFFSDEMADATHLAKLSREKFHAKDFTDLSASGPMYLKEFYAGKIIEH